MAKFLRGATNFIDDMVWSNCQRPFYIYVATAVPCFIDAIIALRLFDFGDMVRATGEAASHGAGRGGRGFRHGVTRRTSEAPGSRRERAYKQGLKHLLTLTQPLEHIGFALLLYGVVDKFYADWMMYLDDADACLGPGFYGPLIRRGDDFRFVPNPEGGAVPLSELIANPANWPGNAFGHTLPIGRYNATFALTVYGPEGGGAEYEACIEMTGVLGSGKFRGGKVFCPTGVPTDLLVNVDTLIYSVAGGTVQWTVEGPSVPVGLLVIKADVMVMRRDSALD